MNERRDERRLDSNLRNATRWQPSGVSHRLLYQSSAENKNFTHVLMHLPHFQVALRKIIQQGMHELLCLSAPLDPKADENLFWKSKRINFSAHKSNKNGSNLNFKSDKCKVNRFNQNTIAPLLQSKCVEQSMFIRKSPRLLILKQSVPGLNGIALDNGA